MSRISEVLKNRNLVEKSQRARRKDELNALRSKAAFNASLNDEMKFVGMLLNSPEIESITVTVPEQSIAKFGEAIYSETMSSFDVQQSPDAPDKFIIRLRTI